MVGGRLFEKRAEEETRAAAERAQHLREQEAEEAGEREERRAQKAHGRQAAEEQRQRLAAEEARRLRDEASVRAAREELAARQDSGIHLHVIMLKYLGAIESIRADRSSRFPIFNCISVLSTPATCTLTTGMLRRRCAWGDQSRPRL